ncbi:MAG: hypothetical protein U1C53_02515, partial [Candidatus Veblenbacteria bacterium]|nr:hypothetical protein [Candidatus Veblenbacteria bacterium]
MAYYICHEHQRGWEMKDSARGHWNFYHKGEKVEDFDEFLEEFMPDGYVLAPKPKQNRVGGEPEEPADGEELEAPQPPPRRGGRQVGQGGPRAPVGLPRDPDAQHLHKRLIAIGVREEEVGTITRGYAEIEHLRDPNALADWLDTHISDRRLKRWIPTVVHDMMELQAKDSRAPYYPAPGAQGPGQPYYYPQQQPYGTPQPTYGGYGYQPQPYAPPPPWYQQPP